MNSRVSCFIAAAVVCMFFLSSCGGNKGDISDRIIRFHVIANSDSEEDQNLKLRVRDAILNDIGPKLEKSGSKSESETIIRDNLESIRDTAAEEIAKSRKGYGVNVCLAKSVFPAKMYSNIVLPAGEYDALKVTIGDGGGKNWWCVMFPPLCFIDITHGITSAETESRLKTVLNDDEYRSILSGEGDDAQKPVASGAGDEGAGHRGVDIKFKSVEIVKSLFQGIEKMISKGRSD